MLKIKFRALNSVGELIYGLPYTDSINSTAYYNEFSNRLCWRDSEGKSCNQPYKNGTLMQFTGLYDSTKWKKLTEQEKTHWISQGESEETWNGKEIYFSDIIRYKDESGRTQTGIVKQRDYFYGFIYALDGDDEGNQDGEFHPDYQKDYKVLGNIYQNPELIGGESK